MPKIKKVSTRKYSRQSNKTGKCYIKAYEIEETVAISMQNESADLIQEDEVCVIDCSNRSEPDMFASQFEMNESPCFDFRYQLSQRHFEQEQIGWEISQTRGAPETEISQLESIKIAQENATEKQENGKGAALEMLQVYSSPTEDKQQPEIEANENFADKNTNDLISEYIAQAKRIDELLKVIIFESLKQRKE